MDISEMVEWRYDNRCEMTFTHVGIKYLSYYGISK